MNSDVRKCIECIKSLSLDMIESAGSGHPGIALGAAPIMYNLFTSHLIVKPEDDKWLNRDRFVMSAGHGSALLYSVLFFAGYNIDQNELKKFRQIDSILPGHPEFGRTPGVEMTTGPLGQGLASAVGMAVAERYYRGILKNEDEKQKIIDHNIYVLCGDGDLMEGVSYEAASFAGRQKLGKLIVLYDSNDITLDGKRSSSMMENVRGRFEAMGWHTEFVKDVYDFKTMDKAINNAKKIQDKPSLIEIKTVIGEGTTLAGTNAVHGKPLTSDESEALRRSFLTREVAFNIPKDSVVHFRNKINSRVNSVYLDWTRLANDRLASGTDKTRQVLNFLLSKEQKIDFDSDNIKINLGYVDELRNSNNQIMNIVSDRSLNIFGGSADLASSCKTELKNYPYMTPEETFGKNIAFGIREHAMGGILNGIATYGPRVFGSTFLVFSDYLKPSIRMSALMNVPVTYIFTHDSVSVGEDGATHEPVEQLGALRAIPNLTVYRPADINEIIGVWELIIKDNKPNALVISKQKVGLVDKSDSKSVVKGAYIVKSEVAKLDGIIMASGTEVETAVKIAREMYKDGQGLDIRVISAPCLELFKNMGKEYRNSLLPVGTKVIALEASNDSSWYKYTYNEDYVLGIEDFGYSGKSEDVLKKFGFDYQSLYAKIEKLLK